MTGRPHLPAFGGAAASGLAGTIPDRLARALAARIVEGALAPGQRLVEVNIATEFGVSHGPVRDALRALERLGLVTIAPYRGAVVREVSVREVTELYQVRAALVGLRARWIAEDSGHRAFADSLQQHVDALHTLLLASDGADAYVDAALAINAAFTGYVANPWLRSMLESLSMQTARYTRLGLHDPRRRHDSAAAWSNLLDAIRAGDGEVAERVARANSLALRDAAIRALKERDEVTEPAKTVSDARRRNTAKTAQIAKKTGTASGRVANAVSKPRPASTSKPVRKPAGPAR